MINEDWEYEAQKDSIYLLEEMEMLKAEFYADQLREEAIILTLKTPIEDAPDKEVADIRRTDKEGNVIGPDIYSKPAE